MLLLAARHNRRVQRGPSSAVLSVREAGQGERSRWDTFVARSGAGNLMQSWGWGELRRQFGWQVLRLVAQRTAAGEPLGTMQVLHRRVGPGGLAWAYSPRGPALGSGEPAGVARALLRAARRALVRHGVVALRLDPEWPLEGPRSDLVRKLGLTPAPFDIQHRRTWLLDLSRDPDQLFARLPASTRRNIRLAGRAGVVVAAGPDPSSLDTFYRLHLETVRRQRFQTRPLAYYQAVVGSVGARTFVASSPAGPQAAAIAVAFGGRLIYLYGGSLPSPDRAPYALHWEIIRWGVERGCSVYDMWGVPSRFEAGDREPGYAVFKTRWGGRLAAHSGLLEAPWLGPLDRLVSAAERRLLSRRPLLT